MLAKKYRLTKHGSFNYVYRKGTSSHIGALSLIYVRGGKGTKVGFSVPNKVGKAVYRNKVKRRMRAVMQARVSSLVPVQLVICAGKGACELSYERIEATTDKLLEKAGLFKCGRKTL